MRTQFSGPTAAVSFAKDNATSQAHCWFCGAQRFVLNRELGLLPTLDILTQDELLFVTPDIAPIVPGHILVVSHVHYRGLAEAPNSLRAAVARTIEDLRRYFAKILGTPVLFFEHCSSRESGLSGCVDHLHVHCMPWKKVVREDVSHILDIAPQTLLGELDTIPRSNLPYIYLQDIDGENIIFEGHSIPSQFFRSYFLQCGFGDGPIWQIACGADLGRRNYYATYEMIQSFALR